MIMQKWFFYCGIVGLFLTTACGSNEKEGSLNRTESTTDMSESRFNFFTIEFDKEVKISEYRKEGNYTAWLVEFETGKLFVETIVDDSDSSQQGSISMYDNVLSISDSERESYSVEQLIIDKKDFRLVERKFSKDKAFIELFGVDVCTNSSLLITASEISTKNLEWIRKSFQTIKLKCPQ